jgi:hypothetical protein
LPKNLDSVRIIERQGYFLPKSYKKYTFIYQVHSDGSPQANDSSNPQPNICWSLYAKLGRQTEMIWKFHRFSPFVLKEVYPNFKDVSLNQASQLSLFNASDQGDLEMGLSQAPLDRLARYLEYVCRMIAD